MKILLSKACLWAVVITSLLITACGGPMKQGKKYFEAGLYDEAVRSYELAVRQKPNDAGRKIRLAQAKEKAAEKHYSDGRQAEQNESWEKAAVEYEKVLSFIPDYEDARERLANVKSADALESYQQGLKFQENKNWDAALEAFQKCLELVDNYKDSENRIRDVKESAAKEHYQLGLSFESTGRWSESLQEYQRVEQYIPNYEDISEHLGVVHQALASQCYDEGLTCEEAQDWRAAFNHYKQAQSHVPGYEDIDERIRQVSYKIAEELVQEGDSYVVEAESGNRRALGERALDRYEEAKRYVTNYTDIQKKINQARDLTITRIAIQPFKGDRDISSQITQGIINYLVKTRDPHIRVVERAQLNAIMSEIGLGTTGIIDSATISTVGKIKGVDVLTFGEIMEHSYTPKKEYEVKEETKFDPKRPEGQRRYKVSYKYYTEERKAYIKASVRLINAETAEIEWSDIIEATVSDKASWREGKESRVKLKSADTLRAKVISDVVSQFSSEIVRRYR